MNSNTTESSKGLWLLICPIVGFIKSLGDAHTKSSQIVIVLFCCIAGWLMCPYSHELDLFRYVEQFDYLSTMSTSAYLQGLQDFLSFETKTKDYYLETVVFLISRVTSNFHFYYLFFGFVFGLFFAKSMSIFSEHICKNSEVTRYYKYLIFLLVFTIPFTLISSIRMWTAAWVGIYIVLKVFLEKKYRFLLLLPLTVFIHGSYTIFIALILLALICERFPKLNSTLAILVYVSIPMAYLSFALADYFYQFMPTPLQALADSYMDEKQIAALNSEGTGWSWVSNIFDEAVKILYYLFTIFLTINRRKDKDEYSPLYTFLLVLLIFANFTAGIPSLGGRFAAISRPLLVFLWCVTFRKEEYSGLVKLIPFVYSFSFLYWIYYMLPKSTGILPLFTTPIISFFRFL